MKKKEGLMNSIKGANGFAGFLILMLCLIGSLAYPDSRPMGFLSGVCFSPVRINQNPDCGVLPTESEILEDLRFIKDAGITQRIRTYSCLGTLGSVPRMCNQSGIECWPGAWLSRNRQATESEVEALIRVGQKGFACVPVLIVGNEVLLRDDMTEDQLIKTIRRVKRETGKAVAYAEIGGVMLKHPDLVRELDVVMVHLYPYWDGHPIDGAVDSLRRQWDQICAAFPNKRIVIGETGWPSAGETRFGGEGASSSDSSERSRVSEVQSQKRGAIPSPEHQARFFREFVRLSHTSNIEYFYFSLFSEDWKAKQEGVCGANWGIYSPRGVMNVCLKEFLPERMARGMARREGVLPASQEMSVPVCVYDEGSSAGNRFRPTNWMGQQKALALDEYSTQDPHAGRECIQVRFSPEGSLDQWAGIYWVGPYMNHWGDYPGYKLLGAKKVVYWARGERGGETITVSSGGLRSPGKRYSDSFGPVPSSGQSVRLTKNWQRYEIDISGQDTSSVLGGLCTVVSNRQSREGCTFYLDDIFILGEGDKQIMPGPIDAIPAAIRRAQKENVCESHGESAGECFTDVMYAQFRSERKAAMLATKVLAERDVQSGILTLRLMSAPDVEARIKSWRCPLRKTWGQMGRISREGQTLAGQRAEMDIADAIADEVARRCRSGL